MSNYAQPATIAATAIISIAIGFGISTWFAARNEADKPIINPTAWEETAPAQQQVQPVSLTNTAKPIAGAKCSPWEITDVAMEEVLDEMIARGWRPPNQGEAIAAMGAASISTDDPNAPMPYRRNWLPIDPNGEAISDDVTVPAPNDPAGGPPQPIAIEQPAAPPPADS